MTDTYQEDYQAAPQDPQAEANVLGACLIGPGAIDTTSDILQPSDFFLESNGRIYQAILDLHGKGEPVDHITLPAALPEPMRLRIVELAALVPAAGNVAHYARIVKDKAIRRSMLTLALQATQEAHGDGNLDRLEQLVYDISTENTSVDLSPNVPLVVENIHRLYENPQEIIGTPSGYTGLDNLTQGFQPGQLWVVAARPSMGKSALGINIAVRLAGKNIPVAIFTLEMSKAEIVQRALAIGANVAGEKIKNPRKMTPDELARVDECAARLQEAPLYLREAGTLTPLEIRSQTRRLKAKVPDLGLVVVDYMQLLTTGTHDSNNRVQEVSAISRALKATAIDLGVPIMAMSQLSRAVEQRADKRPILSDLRESGSIEQDADLVAFIYRESYYQAPEARGPSDWTEIILAKHRNGPTDTVRLVWLPDKAQFSNPAPVRLAGDMGSLAA